MLKGSKIYSMLTGVCPRCQNESMYVDKNPYLLGTVYRMNNTCGCCGLKYKMEPSFFFGAMYVSYGLGTAVGVAVFVISNLFFGTGLITSFVAIVISLVCLMPIIMRLARNIWINFFIDYDKSSKTC